LWKEYHEESYKRRCEGVPVGSVRLDYINDVEVRQLIDDILQKSLSFEPRDRYQTLSELHHGLSCLSTKTKDKDCTLQCSHQYYDEDYSQTRIVSFPQIEVNYLEAELICANCGSHFNVNILQELIDQMLPALPSDDSCGGLALRLDKIADVAPCPYCGHNNVLGESFNSNRLLLPKIGNCSTTYT